MSRSENPSRPTSSAARKNAEKQFNSLEKKEEQKSAQLSSIDKQIAEVEDDTIIGRSVVMRIGAKRANVLRNLNKVRKQKSTVQARLERYNKNDEAYYKEKGLYWK